MLIREATPDDAEQLIAHVQRLASEPDSNIPLMPGEFQVTVDEERELLEKYVAADNSVFLVAEDNGRIVGVLNCNGGKRQAARHSVVLGMSVVREWRNKGVGGKLLLSAIEWAKASRVVTRIELAVYTRNSAAIHLYQKFNFVEEGCRKRAFLQHGEYIDELIMSLQL